MRPLALLSLAVTAAVATSAVVSLSLAPTTPKSQPTLRDPGADRRFEQLDRLVADVDSLRREVAELGLATWQQDQLGALLSDVSQQRDALRADPQLESDRDARRSATDLLRAELQQDAQQLMTSEQVAQLLELGGVRFGGGFENDERRDDRRGRNDRRGGDGASDG
jgi:hypothetical protein